MSAFTTITGIAAPLPEADIDTDVIFPARFLLLLETPGPSIARTNFVSRDNPTGTAANLFRFLAASGIPRRIAMEVTRSGS